MGFEARLCREDGWTAWAAGAQVCQLPLFRAESQARIEIPPLPRAAAVRRVAPAPFRPGSRAIREPLQAPATRSHAPGFRPARTFRNRELVLGMPISIAGEDFSRLPKVLNMRFTVQLVKATGENIRNLDVLGVYRVPVKGVVSLRHDPATGRLLVDLGPEALGVARGRFILARRKDDRVLCELFRGGMMGFPSGAPEWPDDPDVPDPTVPLHSWGDMETTLRKRRPDEAGNQPGEWALVVYAGANLGRVFPLVPGDNVIGRSPQVGITLLDEEVSRLHSCLRMETERGQVRRIVLEDLKSTNGTFLNGRPLLRPAELSAGDRVAVGSHILKLIAMDPLERAFHETLLGPEHPGSPHGPGEPCRDPGRAAEPVRPEPAPRPAHQPHHVRPGPFQADQRPVRPRRGGTSCWRASGSGSARTCAAPTWPAASAARSSSWSCRRPTSKEPCCWPSA